MNLNHLSNQELSFKTETLAKEERRISVEVLWCLKAVEERLLYAELGYSSIYEYATKKLLYSEGSAHRRISAMRLLKALPSDEQEKAGQKIKTGELNVTNLSLIQSNLQIAKNTGKVIQPKEKLELINRISYQSKSQTERLLAEKFPENVPEAHSKIELGQGKVRISIDLLPDEFTQLQDLQNLTGEGVFKTVLMSAVKDKLKSIQKKQAFTKNNKSSDEMGLLAPRVQETIKNRHSGLARESIMSRGSSASTYPHSHSRYLASEVKRQVWNRDQGKCTFVSRSGARCDSRFALQFDHIHPYALGGSNEAKNLRLRCPAHNRLHSVRVFGEKKIMRSHQKIEITQ